MRELLRSVFRETDRAEQWRRPVERQKEAVCSLIEDGELTGAGEGTVSETFEERFAGTVDADYCLTTNHGSTALASAYYAVGVGPGDEVITPTVGYIGAYAGAMHLGARPVFCDVDGDTLLPDPADVADRITDRTAAINVVHLNGRVCDMDAFRAVSEEYDVPLVSDASHAHGTSWFDEPIGSVADVTCFSMQGVGPDGKPVTAGEGGIVTTDDRELYERQLSYCHLHRNGIESELTDPQYDRLDEEVLGRKWRAHPLALALADVSLDSLAERVRKRTEYRERLRDGLEPIPGVRVAATHDGSETGGLTYGIKVIYDPGALDGLAPSAFVDQLRNEGVLVERGFTQLEHLRGIFTDGYDVWGDGRSPIEGSFCGLPEFEPYSRGDFPVAERLNDRVLTVPSFIEPRDGLLEEFVTGFEAVAARNRS